MFTKVIWITGMPRSGTTWLSQVFASHPDIRLKFCPLFSYEFKNALDENSSADEWRSLLESVYYTQSEYLDQEYLRKEGLVPSFTQKNEEPSVLAIKSTRFHNLTSGLVEKCPGILWVAIVRHPCASINSWLSSPYEFPPDADPKKEWRSGKCRKTGAGEFWGFNDWKTVTSMFLELEENFPNRFRIIQYETLVRDANNMAHGLFAWAGLDFHSQTDRFLRSSQGNHVNHRRSVFKSPSVLNSWRKEIDPEIQRAIEAELAGTPLFRFM